MKYTRQEARKILGLTKESSKDDIEKKYEIALKKYKILKASGSVDDKSEEGFQKCTDAYRILMGYETNQPKGVEKHDTYTAKALQKAGIDSKKADNFFYYYKYHIIIGAIVLIFIALTVKSFVTRVDPDITIGLMGEVNQQAYESFGAKIKKDIPEIKEIAFDSASLSDRFEDPQAYAQKSKAMILLSVSDTDLLVVSKYVYDTYAQNGPFMPLEDVAKSLDIDVSPSDYLKLKVVDEWIEPDNLNGERKVKSYRDKEPRLYGIDVTNSQYFKGVDIIGPEKILVVKTEPKNRDLILKLIKLFAR